MAGAERGTPINIPLETGGTAPAPLDPPPDPFAIYGLAHGAGAGMAHPFMSAVASGLAARGVSVLRFDFPFMAAGSRRPDAPAVAHGAVRAAATRTAALAPGLPLFGGGKSYGGRMTSQCQAASPLPGVRGLVFLGFPLHPAGQPSTKRALHLDGVRVPMLFVQGTRDALAELELLAGVAHRLPLASLE